jgi:hypothetical protein
MTPGLFANLATICTVKAWIERVKKLKGFSGIEGLDDPLVRRR